ncbi:MAG: cell division protein FtsZ [Candidatus Parcubacteria bacterium]|nr:cell division protein FtsZ [Candidatus Parcubacteria bacterium]
MTKKHKTKKIVVREKPILFKKHKAKSNPVKEKHVEFKKEKIIKQPHFSAGVNIKVVGVGGAGGNVVNRIFGKKIKDIKLIAINTDAQALQHNRADLKINIGRNLTRGLGAGMDPEIGRQSAEESREEIEAALAKTDLVFLTCGLGGGTGSGAAPVVAEAAKKNGALVIAVVTKPFSFEGTKRTDIAEEAWQRLKDRVDAIVTIPNDRVFNLIDKDTPILKAFGLVDDILRQGVQGISDLITFPGIINIDYANIKTTMEGAGKALMGIGKAKGAERALKAAQAAIQSPLLDISIDGATRVLFNISGTSDMSLVEINEAARAITESIDKHAKVIFGAVYDNSLAKGEIKVTVIAGGFDGATSGLFNHLPLESKMFVASETIITKPLIESWDEEQEKELEIPAFLKKKNLLK